jgi:transaldolase
MGNPWLELKKHGQSVWYDNLNRQLILNGELQRMVERDGVSGGTSNPSIFEKALSGSDCYDEHFATLIREGRSQEEIYDTLTVTDVQQSADVFRPAYEQSNGADGFASLEVSPLLAYDTRRTVEDARRLFKALDRPNVMIKIPGTKEGLPAIEECLAEGLNINITLLFSVENYEQVAWAYISALEKRYSRNQPIDRIGSVASFFVSRVDTITDDTLDRLIAGARSDAERQHLRSLKGKAGIANAKIAYQKYKEIFSSTRWKALAEKGARPQRCLWASTSTKNPDYRDVMYVEELIGPDTVNTVPDITLDAFRDHGRVAPTLEADVDKAFEHMRKLADVGIDFKALMDELQTQGVKLFSDSFNKAHETLASKREELLATTGKQQG